MLYQGEICSKLWSKIEEVCGPKKWPHVPIGAVKEFFLDFGCCEHSRSVRKDFPPVNSSSYNMMKCPRGLPAIASSGEACGHLSLISSAYIIFIVICRRNKLIILCTSPYLYCSLTFFKSSRFCIKSSF